MTISLTFLDKKSLDRRNLIKGRGGAGRNSRDHDSGLRADGRHAIRPNGRPNLQYRSAALGTATREPLSGFSSGVC